MNAPASTITTAAPLAVASTAAHDAAEATRRGTDWDGIVEAHFAVLAMLGLIESRRS
jgi:hypothetical protein